MKCGDPRSPTVGATFNPATTQGRLVRHARQLRRRCRGPPLGRDRRQLAANATGRADGIWAVETDGAGRGTARCFFRVPAGAEMCGPYFTPDDTPFFVAVQHPGEERTIRRPAHDLREPERRAGRISRTTCRRARPWWRSPGAAAGASGPEREFSTLFRLRDGAKGSADETALRLWVQSAVAMVRTLLTQPALAAFRFRFVPV